MTDSTMRRDTAQPSEASEPIESHESADRVINAQEPSADPSLGNQANQAESHEGQPSQPPTLFWDNVATQVGRLAGATYRFFRDVILGRRATHLVPTAPYVLRTTGVLLVVSAIVMPMLSTAIPGIIGWIADTVVNLFIAYLVFLAADVMHMLQDLSQAAQRGTEAD